MNKPEKKALQDYLLVKLSAWKNVEIQKREIKNHIAQKALLKPYFKSHSQTINIFAHFIELLLVYTAT